MSTPRDPKVEPSRPLLTRMATAFAFLLALVCIVAATYCHLRFPVHYESEVRLWLDPFVPDISNTNNVVAVLEPRSVRPYRNTLALVLDSAPIARAAARTLLADGGSSLPETFTREENELTQAISTLTHVRTSNDDAVLTVVGSHKDDVLPPVLANAVADAFIAFNMRSRLAPYSNAVEAIAREVERLGFAQVDHVTALERFQEKHRAEDVEARRASLVAKLSKVRSDLTQASEERQLAETDWASMASVTAEALYQVDVIANDPRAVAARQALVKQVAQVRVLEQRYREKHPRLKEALAAQESLRADMVGVCREVREGMAERLQTARARETQIRADVADAENALRALGVIIREAASLEARANAAIVNLDRMRDRLYDARLALSLVVNDVQIIDRATAPAQPRRDPAAGRFLLLALALTALALVLRAVSRPCRRIAPLVPINAEDTPAEPAEAAGAPGDVPPLVKPRVPVDTPRPDRTPAPEAADAAATPVSTRDNVPPRLASPVAAASDEFDVPEVTESESMLPEEPSPEIHPEVDVSPATPEADPAGPAPAPELPGTGGTEDPDRPAEPAAVPEQDDTGSDAFWAQLKHPTLDELESGAVNAGENVGEVWMALLSHVVAAQDRDRLVRLARHLRMTRPFGDRVRRLAEGHLARVRDDLEGAAQIYAAGLTSSPEAYDLLGGLARCQLFMGDRDGVQASLNTAATHPQADIAYVRAMLAMEEGDSATARSQLRACITHVPDIDAMICLAGIAIGEERFRLAEKPIRYALNISPQHVGALDVLGVILYRQGNTGEAMRIFEKALVHGPEAWGTMIHLVELYNETGESRKATGLIRRLRANRDRLDEEWVEVLEQLESGGKTADER